MNRHDAVIGPLYATDTVSGPHSPEHLAALLRLAGMTAASWMAERLLLERDEARAEAEHLRVVDAATLETAVVENYDAGKLDGIGEMRACYAHLRDTLELCYDHCRLFRPELEGNNVGEAVRAALDATKGL